MEKNMKQGIIFDLDGTLWEVIDSTLYSVNTIAKKYNYKQVDRETICKVFGLNKEESAKLYFPDIPLEHSLKIMDEIADINIKNLKKNGGNIYDNVELILKELNTKFKLYIVSNTAEIEYIEAFFEASGTKKYFDDYIAASEIGIFKYEAILKVINENKLDRAIYIGDTIGDLDAAKKANIKFLWAKYGFGKNLKTKYSIDTINELPSLVEKILAIKD